MTCKKCEKDFVWRFTNKRTLCREHFIRYIKKKVRYTLRRYKMLEISDSLCIDKDIEEREVLMSILKDVCRQRGCRIIKISNANAKLVLGDCLDDISYMIINEMINGNEKNLKRFLPVVKNGKKEIIRPLYFLLKKEIELYARLKGVEYNAKKKGENKTQGFIDELEQEHKEVKNAIVNGYLRVFG